MATINKLSTVSTNENIKKTSLINHTISPTFHIDCIRNSPLLWSTCEKKTYADSSCVPTHIRFSYQKGLAQFKTPLLPKEQTLYRHWLALVENTDKWFNASSTEVAETLLKKTHFKHAFTHALQKTLSTRTNKPLGLEECTQLSKKLLNTHMKAGNFNLQTALKDIIKKDTKWKNRLNIEYAKELREILQGIQAPIEQELLNKMNLAVFAENDLLNKGKKTPDEFFVQHQEGGFSLVAAENFFEPLNEPVDKDIFERDLRENPNKADQGKFLERHFGKQLLLEKLREQKGTQNREAPDEEAWFDAYEDYSKQANTENLWNDIEEGLWLPQNDAESLWNEDIKQNPDEWFSPDEDIWAAAQQSEEESCNKGKPRINLNDLRHRDGLFTRQNAIESAANLITNTLGLAQYSGFTSYPHASRQHLPNDPVIQSFAVEVPPKHDLRNVIDTNPHNISAIEFLDSSQKLNETITQRGRIKLNFDSNISEDTPVSSKRNQPFFPAAEAAYLPIPTNNTDDAKRYTKEYEQWRQGGLTTIESTNSTFSTDSTNSTSSLITDGLISENDFTRLTRIVDLNKEDQKIVAVLSFSEALYASRHGQLFPRDHINDTTHFAHNLRDLVNIFIAEKHWYQDNKLKQFLIDVRHALSNGKQIESRRKRDIVELNLPRLNSAKVPNTPPDPFTLATLDSLYAGASKDEFLLGLFYFTIQTVEHEQPIEDSQTVKINVKQQGDQATTKANRIQLYEKALRAAFEAKLQFLATMLFSEIIQLFESNSKYQETAAQKEKEDIKGKIIAKYQTIKSTIAFAYQHFYQSFQQSKNIDLSALSQSEGDLLLKATQSQAQKAKDAIELLSVSSEIRNQYKEKVNRFLQNWLLAVANQSENSDDAPFYMKPTINPTTPSPYSDEQLAEIAQIVAKLKLAGHQGVEEHINKAAIKLHREDADALDKFLLLNNATGFVDLNHMVQSCTLENFVETINPLYGLGMQFKRTIETVKDELDATVLTVEDRKRIMEQLKEKLDARLANDGSNADLSDLRDVYKMMLSPLPDIEKLKKMGFNIKTGAQEAYDVTWTLGSFILPLLSPPIAIGSTIYDIIEASIEGDTDICRYIMDIFILATSVIEPEEAGIENRPTEHPVFGEVKDIPIEDKNFLAEHLGSDENLLKKLSKSEPISTQEIAKAREHISQESPLISIDGQTERYALVHDSYGSDMFFKEVVDGNERRLELVDGFTKEQDNFEISEDGNHVRRKNAPKGTLGSPGEIKNKLQDLHNEKIKTEHQLEHTVNEIAETKVAAESQGRVRSLIEKYLLTHPSAQKLLKKMNNYKTKWQKIQERTQSLEKSKQKAAEKLNTLLTHIRLLEHELASTIELKVAEADLSENHKKLVSAQLEYQKAKENVSNAKALDQTKDVSELAKVESQKWTEYQDIKTTYEEKQKQVQLLKQTMKEDETKDMEQTAKENADKRIEEHMRCKRADDKCVAGPSHRDNPQVQPNLQAVNRQAVPSEFWSQFDTQMSEPEFHEKFAEFMKSNLEIAAELEERAKNMETGPEKLSLYRKAVLQQEIKNKAKSILSHTAKIAKLEKILQNKELDTRTRQGAKRERNHHMKNAMKNFYNSYSDDYKEYIAQDSNKMASVKIEALKRKLARISDNTSKIPLDMDFTQENIEKINLILNEIAETDYFKKLEDTGQGSSSHQIKQFVKNKLTEQPEEIVDYEDIKKSQRRYPSTFYVTKLANAKNRCVVSRLLVKAKMTQFMLTESEYRNRPSTKTREAMIQAKMQLNDAMREFTADALETQKYEGIVGTEKEDQLTPEWNSLDKMLEWAKNSKQILKRTHKNIENTRREYNGLLAKLEGIDDPMQEVDSRVQQYIDTEGQNILEQALENLDNKQLAEEIEEPSANVEHSESGAISTEILNRFNDEGREVFEDIVARLDGTIKVEKVDLASVDGLKNQYPLRYFKISLAHAQQQFVWAVKAIRRNVLDIIHFTNQRKEKIATNWDGLSARRRAIARELKNVVKHASKIKELETIFSQGQENDWPANKTRQELKNDSRRMKEHVKILAEAIDRTDAALDKTLKASKLRPEEAEVQLNKLINDRKVLKALAEELAKYNQFMSEQHTGGIEDLIHSDDEIKVNESVLSDMIEKTGILKENTQDIAMDIEDQAFLQGILDDSSINFLAEGGDGDGDLHLPEEPHLPGDVGNLDGDPLESVFGHLEGIDDVLNTEPEEENTGDVSDADVSITSDTSDVELDSPLRGFIDSPSSLAQKGKAALKSIFGIVKGSEKIMFLDEYLKAKKEYSKKYSYCLVSKNGRFFSNAMLKVKYEIVKILTSSSQDFLTEIETNASQFWAKHSKDMAASLKNAISKAIEYRKALEVIIEKRENEYLIGQTKQQLAQAARAIIKSSSKYDERFTNNKLKLEKKVQDSGMNEGELNNLITKLLDSNEIAEAIYNQLKKDPEYSHQAEPDRANHDAAIAGDRGQGAGKRIASQQDSQSQVEETDAQPPKKKKQKTNHQEQSADKASTSSTLDNLLLSLDVPDILDNLRGDFGGQQGFERFVGDMIDGKQGALEPAKKADGAGSSR